MTEETDVAVGAASADPLSCQLCGAALRADSALKLSGHTACEQCVAQVQAELDDRQAGASNLPLALAGTLLGAGVGAAVWAGIAIGTDYQIGYVAVLVGFLAGKGATLLTGGAHGRPLQLLSVVGAVIGLLAAKYAIFAHYMRVYVLEELGETIGYLDTRMISNFFDALGEMTEPFDLLWIALAVSAAWRVPASPTLHVERP